MTLKCARVTANPELNRNSAIVHIPIHRRQTLDNNYATSYNQYALSINYILYYITIHVH